MNKGGCKPITKKEPIIIPYNEDSKDSGVEFGVVVGKFKDWLPDDFMVLAMTSGVELISISDHEEITTYWGKDFGTYTEALKLKSDLIAKGFENAKIVCSDPPKTK